MTDMQATLVDSMGSDLTVVNAARVSFNSHSDELTKKDIKLISFLSEHGHWSPFAHVQLTLRVKAPIFCARQLVKHQVGLTWNEISRRYVDSDIEFYEPKVWRKAAENVKQGSSTESSGWEPRCSNVKNTMTSQQLALAEYFDAIDAGVESVHAFDTPNAVAAGVAEHRCFLERPGDFPNPVNFIEVA